MSKQFRSAYLYSDGHAVLVFEKQDKDAGTVQFCEIIEAFGPACSFKGRIVFSFASYNGVIDLVKGAKSVSASMPRIDAGSNATRERGFAVGTLSVTLKSGNSIHFHDMPGLLSGPYTYQDDVEEVFNPEASLWSGIHVARVVRKKMNQEPQKIAA